MCNMLNTETFLRIAGFDVVQEFMYDSIVCIHVNTLASPYNPDGQITWSAISRLQAAGLPIVDHTNSSFYLQTWRSLYGILEQLGLQELSQQVEQLLTSKHTDACFFFF